MCYIIKNSWYNCLPFEEPCQQKGPSEISKKENTTVGTLCSSLSSQMLLLKVAEELMTLAYENGINLFDTAEVYNSGK